MANPTSVTACLIIIGNEILSGRTQDTNLNFLAKRLSEIGIQLREARVIPDVADTIITTVNEVRRVFDYVFTTGGIGPTHDDITADSIAGAFGVKLVIDPDARRALEDRIGKENMNEARLRMARVPEGASLVLNKLSAAPGFRMENVFVLAGVPAIAQSMIEWLLPHLTVGAKTLSKTISCNLQEGTIAKELSDIQDRYPSLEIGSYPAWHAGGFKVSLVLRGVDEGLLGAAASEVKKMIEHFDAVAVEE